MDVNVYFRICLFHALRLIYTGDFDERYRSAARFGPDEKAREGEEEKSTNSEINI